MQSLTIRNSFDENWPTATTKRFRYSPHSRVNGEHVVSVDLQTLNPVRRSLCRDRYRGGLTMYRNRKRVLVVFAVEDCWSFQNAGEIQACVEVICRRTTVAEVSNRDDGFRFQFRRERETDGLHDLRAHRT